MGIPTQLRPRALTRKAISFNVQDGANPDEQVVGRPSSLGAYACLLTVGAGVSTDSLQIDALALRRYLDLELPEATKGALAVELISGGKSNLTYRLTDGERRWVLRRPPLGHVFDNAHDVAREFRVMSALAGTEVVVPRMVARCEDPGVIGAPFYVMAEVKGVVYRHASQLAGLSEAQRAGLARALVDTLAKLHSVDPTAVGLGDLGRPDGYLKRQLARWVRQYESTKMRELPSVVKISELLHANLPVFVSGTATIVHGDYRIDNVMFAPGDPGRIVAVLDWEMATLGDPLTDLGILISFWDEPGQPHNPITAGLTALPGFLSATEVVARYVRGRDVNVAHLDWYIVFGFFKLAVILEQIYSRHLRGETPSEGFDNVGAMVQPVLERALDIAAHSSLAGLRS